MGRTWWRLVRQLDEETERLKAEIRRARSLYPVGAPRYGTGTDRACFRDDADPGPDPRIGLALSRI